MGTQISSLIPDGDIHNSETQEEFLYSMSSQNPKNSKPITKSILDVPKSYKNFVIVTTGAPDHVKYWQEQQIFVCAFTISDLPIQINYYHLHNFKGFNLVTIHLGKVSYQNMIFFMNVAKYNLSKSDFLNQIIYVSSFPENNSDYNDKINRCIEPKLTIASPKIAKLSFVNNNDNDESTENTNNKNFQRTILQDSNSNNDYSIIKHKGGIEFSDDLNQLSENSSADEGVDVDEHQLVINLINSSSITVSTNYSSDIDPPQQKTKKNPKTKKSPLKKRKNQAGSFTFSEEYNGYNDNESDDIDIQPVSKKKPKATKNTKKSPKGTTTNKPKGKKGKRKGPKINIIEDRKKDNNNSVSALFEEEEEVNSDSSKPNKRNLEFNIIEDRENSDKNKSKPRNLEFNIIEDRENNDKNNKSNPRNLEFNIIEDRENNDKNRKSKPRNLEFNIIEDRENNRPESNPRNLEFNIIEDRDRPKSNPQNLELNIIEDRKNSDEQPKNSDGNDDDSKDPNNKSKPKNININIFEDRDKDLSGSSNDNKDGSKKPIRKTKRKPRNNNQEKSSPYNTDDSNAKREPENSENDQSNGDPHSQNNRNNSQELSQDSNEYSQNQNPSNKNKDKQNQNPDNNDDDSSNHDIDPSQSRNRGFPNQNPNDQDNKYKQEPNPDDKQDQNPYDRNNDNNRQKPYPNQENRDPYDQDSHNPQNKGIQNPYDRNNDNRKEPYPNQENRDPYNPQNKGIQNPYDRNNDNRKEPYPNQENRDPYNPQNKGIQYPYDRNNDNRKEPYPNQENKDPYSNQGSRNPYEQNPYPYQNSYHPNQGYTPSDQNEYNNRPRRDQQPNGNNDDDDRIPKPFKRAPSDSPINQDAFNRYHPYDDPLNNDAHSSQKGDENDYPREWSEASNPDQKNLRKLRSVSPSRLPNSKRKPSPRSPKNSVTVNFSITGDGPNQMIEEEEEEASDSEKTKNRNIQIQSKPKVSVSTEMFEFASPQKSIYFEISAENFNYSKENVQKDPISISNPVVFNSNLKHKKKATLNLTHKVVIDKYHSKKSISIGHVVEISKYNCNQPSIISELNERAVSVYSAEPKEEQIGTQTNNQTGIEYAIDSSVFDEPQITKKSPSSSHSHHHHHHNHSQKKNNKEKNKKHQRRKHNSSVGTETELKNERMDDDLSVFDLEMSDAHEINISSKRFINQHENDSDIDVNNVFGSHDMSSDEFAPNHENNRNPNLLDQ